MNNIFVIFLFLLTINQLRSQTPIANEAVKRFNDKNYIPKEEWSLYAVKENEYNILFDFNSKTQLKPASIQKLFTTGIASILLDSGFRYQTKLQYDGIIKNDTLIGNLYIMGSGDPSFGSGMSDSTRYDFIFEKFYAALKSVNIKSIRGAVIGDASVFDTMLIPEKAWKKEDYGNYYGAGCSGLNFHENYYTVYFNPSKNVGEKATLSGISPQIPGMQLNNKVVTAPAKTGDQVIIYGEPYQSQRILMGTIPAGTHQFPVKGSIPDPAYTCAWHFNQYLQQKGLTTSLPPRKTRIPSATRKTLDTYFSPPLKEIIRVINQQSNNTFAESLLKTLAVQSNQKGTTKKGLEIIKTQMQQLCPVEFTMVDGCGLSDKNRTSAKTMVDFLLAMKKQDNFLQFYESLPVAGQSGSLKNVFVNGPLKGNMHAKSGSMKKIKSYAGYLKNKKNETVIFCIIMNNYSTNSGEIQREMEKLLLLLYENELILF